MDDEYATIPLPPRRPAKGLPLAEPSVLAEQVTAMAGSGVGAVSSALDARSVLGTSPTPGGRGRLQTGIAFWARLNALIILGLAIVMRMTDWFETGTAEPPWPAFLLVALLFGTSGAVGRLPLDAPGLRNVDLVSTVMSGAGFALMIWTWPHMPPDSRELVFQLGTAQLLMTRAAVVPSSGLRSFWVGCLTLVPGVVACFMGRFAVAEPWLLPVVRLMFPSIATVVASVLASRRIYGLQKQVNEARRLGPYTLVEKVGAGGMGEVFMARHALLRRPTAIKLIRPENAEASALLQFEREAQLTSQLTHPSTIQIHDFGRSEAGVIYYAMEYIQGVTLHDLVELTGPQPAARVIAILVQICGSLAEAHAVGLVHRDVKPANIMLCERGRTADVVKVLDFGLVKLRGQPGNTLESKSGFIVGTPGFMAPEAIVAPSTVDARADIYALGAVAYFLITGRPLFSSTTEVAMLLDQMSSAPVPMSQRLGAAVPADLDRIVSSCLSKDARDRPQSAEVLAQALLACRDAHGWSQAQARAWWSSHRLLVERRLREKSVALSASFVVEAPGEQVG
jgi:eukaryotic-like serine/threonine-protein kinase